MVTGTQAEYDAIHDRCRTTFGSASEHLCARCGDPAAHWAYQHGAPDEKFAREGGSFPYSLDLSWYAPMCRSCHITLDSNTEAGRRRRSETMAANWQKQEFLDSRGNEWKEAIATTVSENWAALTDEQKDEARLAKQRGTARWWSENRETARELRRKNCLVRRRCAECSVEGNPGNLGKHQKADNHAGWVTL